MSESQETETRRDRCGGCRYFEWAGTSQFCRRFPPSFFLREMTPAVRQIRKDITKPGEPPVQNMPFQAASCSSGFPFTMSDWWCGEFEADAEVAARTEQREKDQRLAEEGARVAPGAPVN